MYGSDMHSIAALLDHLQINASPSQYLGLLVGLTCAEAHVDALRQPLPRFLQRCAADRQSALRAPRFDHLARTSMWESSRIKRIGDRTVPVEALTRNKDALDSARAAVDKHVATGQALLALGAAKEYANVATGAVRSMVLSAFSTRQSKTYFNGADTPFGFVSWAWVSQYTLMRLQVDAAAHLHPSEWNEGESLCFRDVAVTEDAVDAIADDLGGLLFPSEPVCYFAMRAPRRDAPELVRFAASRRADLAQWMRDRVKRLSTTPVPHVEAS